MDDEPIILLAVLVFLGTIFGIVVYTIQVSPSGCEQYRVTKYLEKQVPQNCAEKFKVDKLK